MRSITIPLLGPTLRVSVFLSIIGAIQIFDLVWATTQGRTVPRVGHDGDVPRGLSASGVTQLGYGSAIAVILFVICLVVALFYLRFVMRRDTEGALTTGAG